MALPYPNWDTNAYDVLTSAKIDQLGDNDDYLYSLWSPGVAWTSWTPTWTNVSGGTTNYAKYVQIGKTVHYRIKYTMAGANVSGLVNVTVPVAMHSDYGVVANVDIVGIAAFLDVGSALHHGVAVVDSGKLNIRVSGSAGTYSNPADLSSTVPFTWGSSDILSVSGTYEAA